jgi:hypothetical protein
LTGPGLLPDKLEKGSPGRIKSGQTPVCGQALFLPQFLRLVSGLAPVLSLLTRYCGSSFVALAVWPLMCVSDVIFFSTMPFTLLPA